MSSGTLIRKTEPHQKWASSSPLMTGPNPPAAPVIEAQMAMALVRSWGGKTLIRIDRVDGMMKAAPTPMRARQAMSCHMALDIEAQPAPARKMIRPSWRAPLRPNLSPRAPVVNSRPAKTSE